MILSTGQKTEDCIEQRNEMTGGAVHNVGKDRYDECNRVSEVDVVHVIMRDALRSKGGAMES